MTLVTFVFSNPRHHLEMMLPVAEVLRTRGVMSRFVSLAELRGLTTPAQLPFELHRALPRLRTNPSLGSGQSQTRKGAATLRGLLRGATWWAAMAPRLAWLTRGSDVVVVPNDAAYPYDQITRGLRRLRIPFVLVQEGIRFVTPREKAAEEDAYGKGGATTVCTWGAAAAAHFRAIGTPPDTIAVTGNPRFDTVTPATWRDRADELLRSLGLRERPLLFLSSPIDDLGYCTTSEKLALFEQLLHAAQPVLRAQQRGMIVKLHAREDVSAFEAVVARSGARDVHVLKDHALFSILAAGRAAIIFSSTVGLEALLFGLPLAVMAIPGHGHVFDYVSDGAALPFESANLDRGVEQLLADTPPATPERVAAFLEKHLAHRGDAANQMADRVLDAINAR